MKESMMAKDGLKDELMADGEGSGRAFALRRKEQADWHPGGHAATGTSSSHTGTQLIGSSIRCSQSFQHKSQSVSMVHASSSLMTWIPLFCAASRHDALHLKVSS